MFVSRLFLKEKALPADTIGVELCDTKTWPWDTSRFPEGMIVWCHLEGVDTAAEVESLTALKGSEMI